MGPSIKPRYAQDDHTTIICVVLYTILYSSVCYMLDHQSILRLYKLTIQRLFVWFIYYFVQFCSLYVGPSIKPRSVQVDHTTVICVVLYTILYSSVRYMWENQSSLRLYKLTIQRLFVWFYILFCTVLFVICGTINQASVCTS